MAVVVSVPGGIGGNLRCAIGRLAVGLVALAGCRRPTVALTGTASYPGPPLGSAAAFEATLIEAADSARPPRVVAALRTGGPGPSPIRFTLPYDRSEVDPGQHFLLQARILEAQSVRFTAGEGIPVRPGGGGTPSALVLQPVEVVSGLPASFVGSRSCEGCRTQLDLHPDSVYYLRIAGGADPDSATGDAIGRWSFDSATSHLVLRDGSHSVSLAGLGASLLRPPDGGGWPELRRTSQVPLLEPRLELRGRYAERAGQGLFTECVTGIRFVLEGGAGRPALARRARDLRAGGSRQVEATLDARLPAPPSGGSGGPPALVVERLVGARVGKACDRP